MRPASAPVLAMPFVTGTLCTESLPPRPATSRPASDGRTYMSKIKLQLGQGSDRRMARIRELELQQTPDASSATACHKPAIFPVSQVLRFSQPTASKALERRLSELEFRLTNMQALNQSLLTQMQQEKTARSAAESECKRLKDQLERAQDALRNAPTRPSA